jgi:hypothetical protein
MSVKPTTNDDNHRDSGASYLLHYLDERRHIWVAAVLPSHEDEAAASLSASKARSTSA